MFHDFIKMKKFFFLSL